MKCSDFEKMIALDVGGDLPQPMAAPLAAHLRTCAQCQAFAAGLQSSQAWLKELGEQAPDAEMLQGVRRGVLNQLPNPHAPALRPVWQFALGVAAVALFALAIFGVWHRSRTPVRRMVAERKSPTVLSTSGNSQEAPGLGSVAVPRGPGHTPKHRAAKLATTRPRHTGADSQAEPAQPGHAEPLMVKLLTDNPRVVIYWFVD